MNYRVIKLFTDLQDNNYRYEVGDRYPHLGYEPSKERIAELSGSKNRQKTPLIEATEDVTEVEAAEEIPETDEKTKKRNRKAKTDGE